MTLMNDFQKSSDAVRNLKTRPSNDDLLKLYALFKQATEGDVSGNRPGLLDLKGRKKYDSWAERKGVSKESAMQCYVTLVKDLESRYGS